jgi:thioredoxin reductase (NADPH)
MTVDESGFPVLDAEQVAVFTALGEPRRVPAGEYLYREGDASYDFYVILSGAVDILARGDGGAEHVVVRHGPGGFLGELNLLTGMRVFVSARVAEPVELIAVSRPALRRVLATNPALSDLILAAFMTRRSGLLSGAAAAIRVLGSRFSPELLRIREFLARSRIPHGWLDPDSDAAVAAVLEEFGIEPGELPVVIATGTVLRRPTPGTLAEYLGLTVGAVPSRCFDLVVVGGGPAGLAASVYGASEGLRTLGVEMAAMGGQAGTSSRIENYLGFPTGISGADLVQRAVVQAEKFGATLASPCAATSLREEFGHLVVRLSDGIEVAGRAVIAATGARYRRLDAENLHRFEDAGVLYAATEMEARACAGNPIVIAGGGNSAGQAALLLAESGCRVTIVIRGPELTASMSRYLVDRIDVHTDIEVRANARILRLNGDRSLTSVDVRDPGGVATLRALHSSPSSARTPRRSGCPVARPWTSTVSCSPTGH